MSHNRLLPKGGVLPETVWRSRHRGIVVLLWLQMIALFLFALGRGLSWQHGLVDIAPIAALAVCSGCCSVQRLSTVASSLGLMISSAVLVHLSGGMIEAHFHFFVMVGVVVLYQDWTPFLVAIGFVILHHGVMGALSPHDVFNHQSAWDHPWTWALVHGVSIVAMSLTGIATWRLNESLQRSAFDRQAKLEVAHRALANARDEALRASELKSTFLANTSHEIRTPMTVILGMNELLLDTDLDETQRKFADGVSRAGHALLGIINDILDFSKIEAGHLELEITEVELRPLLDDLSALLADSVRTKGVRLAVTCDPSVPSSVLGDGGRLRQVLLNLATNAVKFTADGSVMVHVGMVGRGQTEMLRFEVADTGIGIAEEDQHRLFQPFSQVDASMTRRYGGTGLGLAISAQLVEAMGGRIGVESILGQGSTFWFELPPAPVPAPVVIPDLPVSSTLQG